MILVLRHCLLLSSWIIPQKPLCNGCLTTGKSRFHISVPKPVTRQAGTDRCICPLRVLIFKTVHPVSSPQIIVPSVTVKLLVASEVIINHHHSSSLPTYPGWIKAVVCIRSYLPTLYVRTPVVFLDKPVVRAKKGLLLTVVLVRRFFSTQPCLVCIKIVVQHCQG